MDALRVQARNALLEGAQSGKLMEAASQRVMSKDLSRMNIWKKDGKTMFRLLEAV